MNSQVEELRNALVAIDDLLLWRFLSQTTRLQLEMFKSELKAELQDLLAEQSDSASAA